MRPHDILPRAHGRFLPWSSSVLPILVALPLLLAASGCEPTASRNSRPPTTAGQRAVYSLGRIEPAGGIVSIGAMPGERLKALHADIAENKHTPESGILGVLASYDVARVQLAALIKNRDIAEESQLRQVEVAEAQRAQAQAALAQAIAQQTEVDLQYNKLRVLESASGLASEELSHLESLRERDPEMVTPNQLRRQRNETELALAEFTIANESYASARVAAQKAVESAEASVRLADLSLEQAIQGFEVQSIEQEIAVARENLKRSVLLAPNFPPGSVEELDDWLDIEKKLAEVNSTPKEAEPSDDNGEDKPTPYTVLRVLLQPGEFISQTPIMQIADLRKMVCIAEVYEADVHALHEGQLAKIRSPAFGSDFAERIDPETGRRTGGIQGRIERIGTVVGGPGIAPRNPLAPADRNVVEVRLAIDDPEAIKHLSHRVGLQVTVEFEPRAE